MRIHLDFDPLIPEENSTLLRLARALAGEPLAGVVNGQATTVAAPIVMEANEAAVKAEADAKAKAEAAAKAKAEGDAKAKAEAAAKAKAEGDAKAKADAAAKAKAEADAKAKAEADAAAQAAADTGSADNGGEGSEEITLSDLQELAAVLLAKGQRRALKSILDETSSQSLSTAEASKYPELKRLLAEAVEASDLA